MHISEHISSVCSVFRKSGPSIPSLIPWKKSPSLSRPLLSALPFPSLTLSRWGFLVNPSREIWGSPVVSGMKFSLCWFWDILGLRNAFGIRLERKIMYVFMNCPWGLKNFAYLLWLCIFSRVYVLQMYLLQMYRIQILRGLVLLNEICYNVFKVLMNTDEHNWAVYLASYVFGYVVENNKNSCRSWT